jgi:hypothetical protein
MAQLSQTKNNNRRFVLNDDGHIVDNLHPENKAVEPFYMDLETRSACDDELLLRHGVVIRRLYKLETKLLKGNKEKRDNDLPAGDLWSVLGDLIKASHLNRRDVLISMQHPFKGKLKRKKTELREFTSISLFVDDVERALRDLYGDVDGDDLDDLLRAITLVVVEFCRYLLPELLSEYDNAAVADHGAGRGLDPDMSVSTRMFRDGLEADHDLAVRAKRILWRRKQYSRYTVKFAKALRKYWPELDGWHAYP